MPFWSAGYCSSCNTWSEDNRAASSPIQHASACAIVMDTLSHSLLPRPQVNRPLHTQLCRVPSTLLVLVPACMRVVFGGRRMVLSAKIVSYQSQEASSFL